MTVWRGRASLLLLAREAMGAGGVLLITGEDGIAETCGATACALAPDGLVSRITRELCDGRFRAPQTCDVGSVFYGILAGQLVALLCLRQPTFAPDAARLRVARAVFEALSGSFHESERSARLLEGVETMAEVGLWEFNVDEGSVIWSDVTYRLHGVDPDTFTPTLDTALSFYPDDVRTLVERHIEQALTKHEGFSFVLPLQRADGTIRTVRSVGQPTVTPNGTVELFGIFQDITDMKEAELRLWWTANHDALTNLPNRMHFQERLDHAFSLADETETFVGLILVDVDHFKSINDVYGHEAGDEVLKSVAEALNAQTRHGDTIARLGGDEFAIIVTDLQTPSDFDRPFDRLLEATELPFAYRGIDIPIRLSLGAALYPRDAKDDRALYRNADLALFHTKERAETRGSVYAASLGAERENKELRLRRVREAVDAGAIEAAYQPVFDLRSGQIASVEVLARWREGGEVSDATALAPAFAEPSLAPLIGARVIDQVGTAWPTLPREHGAGLTLSLNVSLNELRNLTYLELLSDFVAEATAAGADVIAELDRNPMSVLPSQVRPRLERLLGDGLGLGFDSLSAGFEALVDGVGGHLRQIKVSKRTLAEPSAEGRAAAIIGGMVDTCRQLGVQLIATEVETERDLHRLLDFGYTLGQGYHLCQPVNIETLRLMLDNKARVQAGLSA